MDKIFLYGNVAFVFAITIERERERERQYTMYIKISKRLREIERQ